MAAVSITSSAPPSYLYYRHTLPVRIMHWTNFVALTLLFMSGLQIFNAHSALYWGDSSYTGRPPLLEIGARDGANGEPIGVTQRVRPRVRDHRRARAFEVSERRAECSTHFHRGLTIPGGYSLAMARDWHFFFAWIFVLNGVAYVLYSLFSRHLMRDLSPTGKRPARHRRVDRRSPAIQASDRRGREALQRAAEARLPQRDLRAAAAGHPAGLAMSPWLNSMFRGWVDWLGGRQSARTIHFIVAWLLVAVSCGPRVRSDRHADSGINMRSMITGRYRVQREDR